jgi:DNA helicase HerA-like ATPase
MNGLEVTSLSLCNSLLAFASLKAYNVGKEILKGSKSNKKVATTKNKNLLPLIIGYKSEIDSKGNYKVSNELIIKDLTHAPHLLIAGVTGSGKGHFIDLNLQLLQKSKVPKQLLILDLKGLDFNKYENSYTKVIYDLKDIEDKLKEIRKIADDRGKIFRESGVKNIAEYNKKEIEKMPYIIVVVDELAELILSFDGDENKKLKSSVKNKLISLSQYARAFGIHLILATQVPKAEVINTLLRSNCNYKMGLRMENEYNVKTLDMSVAHAPLHKIKSKVGFGYFKDYKGYQFVNIPSTLPYIEI